MILLGILVILILALLFLHMHNRKDLPVVYGSMGCPHTVRHREKIGAHKFVDCTTEECPGYVNAYPTTKYPDGNVVVGAK